MAIARSTASSEGLVAVARELVLVCGVGTQNSGNDASYEVVLDLLRRFRGEEQSVLVTPFPDGAVPIAARTGARIVRLRQNSSGLRGGTKAARAIDAVLSEVTRLREVARTVRGASLLVVTGTGIFDDFGEPPWNMPYALLVWALAARAARVPFACVGAGAGPIVNPVSRVLMAGAARLMTEVSYRDADSLRYMEGIGAGRADARVCPDVVFAHDLPDVPAAQPTRARATVGVGVMAYGGWSKTGDGDVYEAYLAMLATVVDEIVRAGDRVRLIVGQPIDLSVAEDLLVRLAPEVATVVEPATYEEMPGLLRVMGECDVVLATRYHNVVSALLVRRPVVSLSYAPKNAEVLRALGIEGSDRAIEEADAVWVLERLRAIRTGRTGLPPEADDKLTEWSGLVRVEVDRIARLRASVRRGPLRLTPARRRAFESGTQGSA